MSDAADPVAKLYALYEKLEAAEDKSALSAEYQSVLDAVKGDEKQKSLAATFVPKYFHHFPALAESALNAQLDLCEDESVPIRMKAIPGLRDICRNSASHVGHVVTVLGQLLVTEEANAKVLSVVRSVFCDIFDQAPAVAFETLGQQAVGDDEGAAAAAKAFLAQQTDRLRDRVQKEDGVQAAVAANLVAFLTAPGVTRDAFRDNLRKLQRLKIFKNDPSIADTVSESLASQAGIGAAFKGDDPAAFAFADAAVLARAAARKLDVGPWLEHIFTRVIPSWDDVSEGARFAVLKAMVPMTSRASEATARTMLPHVVALLAAAVPEEAAAAAAPAEGEADAAKEGETAAAAAAPAINFSVAEIALFAFHQLGRKADDTVKETCGLFVPTGQPSEFREALVARRAAFLGRVDRLAKGAREHAAKAAEASAALTAQIKETAKEEDEKRKELISKRGKLAPAARVATNIAAMVSALKGKTGPKFLIAGKDVSLSWQGAIKKQQPKKQQQQQQQQKGGKKNKAPQEQQGGNKRQKKGQQQQKPQKQQQQQQQQGKKQKQQQQQQQGGARKRKNKQGQQQQQQQQQPQQQKKKRRR